MAGWFHRYTNSLNRSFAAVYSLLERPKAARRTVIGLLTIHTALLAYSAYVHSPTLNEPGHLVAGLSYWKFGRFDVYNVNPPLVKMVAALPVMAAGYEEDWNGFHSGLGARPEFKMGKDFVSANGERSFFLFTIARWACIPFSWLGGIVCYLWARDLYGRPAGVMACAIWSFEPNILAHASLITPDAHATALGLAACYTFWKWLKKPTWSQAALTGIVLGLAELTKTTLILFYPLWPILWVFYRWPDRRSMQWTGWLREAGMLTLRMAIGLYIVNLGYGFEDSLTPLGNFQFISNLFTGQEVVDGSQKARDSAAATPPAPGLQSPTPFPHNRFAGTWISAFVVPFPRNYLIGIDLQQRDFEKYGRLSYLRGKWRDHGWWYYYLYAVAVKVPLGLWALGILAVVTRRRKRSPVELRDSIILLAPPLIVFTVVSAKTGFSEHMRYVLPCFPFAFVWIGGGMNFHPQSFFWKKFDVDVASLVPSLQAARHGTGTIAVMLSSTLALWFAASSVWIYPHSLSYFNEAVGGPTNGSKHLLGSNVDWGQDFKYLANSNAMRQPDKPPVYLAEFGYFDPDRSCRLRFQSAKSYAFQLSPEGAKCVVSATLLRSSNNGSGEDARKIYGINRGLWRRIRIENADGMICYSLYVIRLD